MRFPIASASIEGEIGTSYISTYFLDLAWKMDHRTGRLILMSVIDNLTKGTSGQAVQCFNLMRGFDETAGLL